MLPNNFSQITERIQRQKNRSLKELFKKDIRGFFLIDIKYRVLNAIGEQFLTYRIKKINEVTRGWINYFRIGSMKQKLHRIDEHLRTQIRVIIWKQWKTAQKREWGLLKLGVPKWLAHKVANWGDHYQFVATKSVLKSAVSKEKLTNRGLVSLSDYYLMVAHT